MRVAEVNGIIIKMVESESEFQQVLEVRHRVFVCEQQIPAEEERDEFDDAALHVIALKQGKALGAGRVILQESGQARIGRMAVDGAFRGQGVGGRILALLEGEARSRGCRESVLHAQKYIGTFYVKRGYKPHGEVFLEVDIPHVEMRKRL